uniref:Uncharacterized protein n=1 Tax=Sphaerodactylus townsendi TaxID=933632 RepID=A0ACB8FQ51_9SAUR
MADTAPSESLLLGQVSKEGPSCEAPPRFVQPLLMTPRPTNARPADVTMTWPVALCTCPGQSEASGLPQPGRHQRRPLLGFSLGGNGSHGMDVGLTAVSDG